MFFKAIINLKLSYTIAKPTRQGYTLIFAKSFSQYASGLTQSNNKPPWKILFFGTDEFAVEHLKALNENCVADKGNLVKSIEVVTPNTDKCVVGKYAMENNLKCFKWPLPKTLDEYDVGVLVSFGHLIPKRIIDAFPYGILNVHPSILPRWRGASPIIHTILNGDTETGISIMGIRPIHFDIGPLLSQSRFPVPERCMTFQLRDYLAHRGSHMLLHVLKNLSTFDKLENNQKEEGVCYANKLCTKNAMVNWKKQTMCEIDRQYRALSEVYELRSLWNGHKVRLLDKLHTSEMSDGAIQNHLKKLSDNNADIKPGFVHYLDSHEIICIKCLDGWNGFKRIMLKKPLTSKMFYNGYLSKADLSHIPFESQENDLEKFKAGLILTSQKTRHCI